jgi:hypothetical protein
MCDESVADAFHERAGVEPHQPDHLVDDQRARRCQAGPDRRLPVAAGSEQPQEHQAGGNQPNQPFGQEYGSTETPTVQSGGGIDICKPEMIVMFEHCLQEDDKSGVYKLNVTFVCDRAPSVCHFALRLSGSAERSQSGNKSLARHKSIP